MMQHQEYPVRRSPLHRRLLVEGRAFGALHANGSAPVTETTHTDVLTLFDLSLLPRWGLKGRNTFAWLAAHGVDAPDTEQKAIPQPDGTLIGRLTPGEAIVLSPLAGGVSRIGAAIDSLAAAGSDYCYPVPRRDSHGWLGIRGRAAPAMFAKLCGVDLSTENFPPGQIAQTSVARLSAIVIRTSLYEQPTFFVLAESASMEYLWDCLLDAMAEFGGVISGADRPRTGLQDET